MKLTEKQIQVMRLFRDYHELLAGSPQQVSGNIVHGGTLRALERKGLLSVEHRNHNGLWWMHYKLTGIGHAWLEDD